MYQVQEPENCPCRRMRNSASPQHVQCSGLHAFVHEIDRSTGCPGAHREVDFLADLGRVLAQLGNRDGLDFDEAARVQRFDLEHITRRVDLSGLFVGAAGEGHGGPQDALKNQHA